MKKLIEIQVLQTKVCTDLSKPPVFENSAVVKQIDYNFRLGKKKSGKHIRNGSVFDGLLDPEKTNPDLGS